MIKTIEFKTHSDPRGSLIAIESQNDIPFELKRIYYIFKNEQKTIRAKHAHKTLKQVYIATSGSCKIRISDGQTEEILVLDKPNIGIFFTQVVWREIFDFSSDCVLMVLADQHYDENDYIKSYEEFLNFKLA